jgi:methyl-accepting chemotaxis protein
VVAAEVRKLAERSQVAAQEIGATGRLQRQDGRTGRQAARRDGAQHQEDLGSRAGDRRIASQEQSQGVGQINGAMGQLNKATQQNASASEELAATAEEMGGQAAQLQELMEFFKIESQSGTRVGAGAGTATKPCGTRQACGPPLPRAR